VLGGGVVAFAVMTMPTHVRGATTSSRLKWQQIKNGAVATDGGEGGQSCPSSNAVSICPVSEKK
jgi:hypothetical protein